MANAYLGRPDWSDGGTISASSERTGFEVDNLLDVHPDDRFEVSSPSSFTIDIGHRSSAAASMRTFSLLYCDASSTSATWAIDAATSQANLTSSPFEVLAATQLWSVSDYSGTGRTAHAFYRHSSEISYEWLRFTITEPTNSIFRAGRLIVSSDEVFGNRNISYGSEFGGFVDRSGRGVTARGRLTLTRGTIARRFRFTATFTTQSDAEELMKLYEDRGTSKDVLFVRDTAATTRMSQGVMAGYFTRELSVEHRAYNQFVVSGEIQER